MGDKRWIVVGGAQTSWNDGLGRFHSQSRHFEAGRVLTDRDDCEGQGITFHRRLGRLSAVTATSEGTTNSSGQTSFALSDLLGQKSR
jgi:hypothetical protein